MYDLPDREDISGVRITAATVRGEAEPEYLYAPAEQSA